MLVHHSQDPERASSAAARFLASDPVRHNTVLSVLAERTHTPAPGHYWWITDAADVVGFAMQTPTTYKVALTPMPEDAVDRLVAAIADEASTVPGVVGEVVPAARFAGQWTERTSSSARPDEGQRLYLLGRLVGGDRRLDVRVADTEQHDLITRWVTEFVHETGLDPPDAPAPTAAMLVASGRLHVLWHEGRPVAMTRATAPMAGVTRIGWVYTPVAERGRGHATTLVSHVSDSLLAGEADTCVLYTQLSNPVSNRIYRSLGYRAIAEVLSYRFA